ncbi:MAG: adenylate/guanylate cyclase domain-containing protein [Mariprofundaceae bacterium]|nr:adenylate/guanylate cyclase domain-containing protein [Mariprofundaceae bacterium]
MVTSVLAFFYMVGAFHSAHNTVSDLLQTHFTAVPHDKPVVYLLITDASLIEAEEVDGISWPWPRSAYVEAIRFLKAAGAKEIVFDMIFTERSVYGVEDDIGFGNAIEQAGIILATLSSRSRSHMSKQASQMNTKMAKKFELEVSDIDKKMFQDYPFLRTPVAEFTNKAKAIGDVKFIQDSDGVGRRIPMLIRSGHSYLPSLALATAASFLGITSYQMKRKHLLLLSGSSIIREIPLDAQGMARPRYYGDSDIYKKYLLLRIIKSQIMMDEGGAPYYDPALFKDKVVIIGSDATELKDFRPNPFNKSNDPGVHYHGTAIHNILNGGFLESRYEPIYVLPVLFLTSLLIVFISARYSAIVSFSFTFLLLLLIQCVAVYLFKYHNLLIDVTANSMNVIGCFILTTGFNYVAEARQRLFITSAFGQYLSPEVVTALVDDPDRLKLGGEVRVMTAFFSDIQGFSTISEKLSPEDLVALLNEYLSDMCEIIGRYNGTVDKFEGDAIMAFWGAPIYDEEHAKLALLASLEMQQRLQVLRRKWVAEGRDPLYVRMGINSGPMLVGNMGSHNRMDYTIMGDAVNLASRLEGANKFYGTYLMLSESTKKLAGELFVTRELDVIQVMGKQDAIHVYELVGEKEDVAEGKLAMIMLFEAALVEYRKGCFREAEMLFTKVLNLIPNDPPALEFLRRLEGLNENALSGGWNGVFKADSKG